MGSEGRFYSKIKGVADISFATGTAGNAVVAKIVQG